MDKIINKIKCVLLGHSISTSQCPVTHAKLSYCSRCGYGKKKHSEEMSFK